MIVNVVLALLGFALVVAGLWWVWPPLAVIVAGCGLLAVGLFRDVDEEVPDEQAR